MNQVLLISDLHLEPDETAITMAFYRFLDAIPKEVDALFILGDFFEVWIGDDDEQALAAEVAARLLTLSEGGLQIFLMHGNRDFLIGEDYARRCGAQLIEDPYVLQFEGMQALLIHGDSLCIDDSDYMAFRSTVRNPDWQAQFLAKPIAERQAFARQARAQSAQDTASKDAGIMDVNQGAVRELLESRGQALLVHGHTHRPAIHELDLAAPERAARRIVLGDWGKKVWFVRMGNNAVELKSYAADLREIDLLA